nr:AAA family ATPase [Bacteroidota bacterium]
MKNLKIAIASGKGGTGKTTIAVNLYHTLVKQNKQNILLVDCDVEEPNDALFFSDAEVIGETSITHLVPEINIEKCTFCRKCVEYCEYNAITVIPPVKYAEVATDLCHSCGACLYACDFDAITEKPFEIGKMIRYQTQNGAGLTEGRLNVGLAFQTPVIRHVKKVTKNHDGIIIYDAPPGTSCSVVSTIADVDFVILGTEPTPFGLHDLKLAVEVVRNLEKSFGIVINKAHLGDDKIYKYLEEKEIPLLVEIPFQREIAEKYAESQILSNVVDGYEDYYLQMIDNMFKLLN